jgi:hypothetical protein
LGDVVARKIASWTRDYDRQEYYAVQLDSAGTLFGSPYIMSGSSTRASASFCSNNLMRYYHRMNEQNTNAGGWGGDVSTTARYQKSMHYFLQNKYYPAVPDEYKSLIAQVKVPSTMGSNSTTVTNYDSYIYIPCVREMDGQSGTGYVNEGEKISWNTTQQRRLSFRDVITLDSSLLANGNAKYTGSSEPIFGQNKGFYDAETNPNGVKEFDIWQNNNNSQAMIYLSAQTLREKNITPSTRITSGTELLGGWYGADGYWLRSPSTGYAIYFWSVYSHGATNNNGAYYWFGVRPCFSFYATITE